MQYFVGKDTAHRSIVLKYQTVKEICNMNSTGNPRFSEGGQNIEVHLGRKESGVQLPQKL